MRITEREFAEVLIDLELASYPRNVGNPVQETCPNFKAMVAYMMNYNGRTPLYTSINSFWDYKDGVPTLTLVSKMKMDMDTDKGNKLQQAHDEIIRLQQYFDQHNLDYRITMTGNGFNFMPRFQPKFYTIDHTLKAYMYCLQQYFKDKLDLQSLNLQCAEPRRLMEMPYTRYATDDKKGTIIVHDNFRTPLPPSMLHSSLKDIIEYSHHPIHQKTYAPEGRRRHPTIADLVRELNIKDSIKTFTLPTSTITTNINPDAQTFYGYTQLLIPIPCVSESLFLKNPPHMIRFSACAFMRKVVSREFAHDYFDKLAEIAEWADRFNHGERFKQVENIYDEKYEPHGCEELIEMGFCTQPRYNQCHRANKIKLPHTMEEEDNVQTNSQPK